MDIIRKVPVPICGVALGFAALGNLLQSYSEGIRSVCGVISALLLLLFVLKLILFPAMIREDMGNPVMASVMPTASMALMLLSTYVKPLIGQGAFVIWIAAIVLHLVLMVYFTVRFVAHFKLPQVFASWYIVYVGIAVAAVTAPAYSQTGIGTIAFWFGFITLIILLVAVTYRYATVKAVPQPAQPLICIYAAPASLCIAGYVQSVTPKSAVFLGAMLIVASALYLFALVQAVLYIAKNTFFPSYAAFTFPFVISAIASKQSMACFANLGSPMPFLQGVVLVETVIAVVLVVYTLIRYLMFLCAAPQKKPA